MRRNLFTGTALALLLAVGSSCAFVAIRGGPVPADRLVDGVYRGRARNGPVRVEVDVLVEDQAIREIALVRHRNWWGAPAEEPVPRAIIEQQSTRVDGVSGATLSSTAIMNAVQDAVEQASN